MKNCVGENTVILSVMNGISSEKIIGERYGHGRLIDTVAQGMDAMKFGSKLTYTKMGELRIGAEDASQNENLEQVAAYFDDLHSGGGYPPQALGKIHAERGSQSDMHGL